MPLVVVVLLRVAAAVVVHREDLQWRFWRLYGTYRMRSRERRGQPPARVAQYLVDLAVLVAGPRRVHLLDMWGADLLHGSTVGQPFTPWRRARYGASCVLAAIVLRATDVARVVTVAGGWVLGLRTVLCGLPPLAAGIVAATRDWHPGSRLHDLLVVLTVAAAAGTTAALVHMVGRRAHRTR